VLIEYYEISARSNKQAMLGSDPRVAHGVAHMTDQHSLYLVRRVILSTSLSGMGKRLRLLFCAQCEKIIVLHEHNLLRTSIIESRDYSEAAMTSIFSHIAQK
jgi:hypothetical protein